MCQPVAGPFYRAAGLTYLRYANICADMMRSVLKEPFKDIQVGQELKDQLASMVGENPEAAANVIRGWLDSAAA